MIMSNFDDNLPAAYKSLKVQLKSATFDLQEQNEIADPDENEYHDCDCEYCPVPEAPDYTDKERKAAAEKVEKLTPVVAEYESTIARIERYAKWRNIELNQPPNPEKEWYMVDHQHKYTIYLGDLCVCGSDNCFACEVCSDEKHD